MHPLARISSRYAISHPCTALAHLFALGVLAFCCGFGAVHAQSGQPAGQSGPVSEQSTSTSATPTSATPTSATLPQALPNQRNTGAPSLPSGWSGNAGLLVSVVDDRGAPLPGAEVALGLGESEQRMVARTDDDGQVEFVGLAAGEWQVDVRREGFMLFNAYVLLELGKKPKVAFSSRQRTGTHWEPLRAVFLPPGVDLSPGVASGRESVRQAQAKADRATRKSRQQERRAAKAADRGRLARVVPTEQVTPTITDLVELKSPAESSAPVADAVAQEPQNQSENRGDQAHRERSGPATPRSEAAPEAAAVVPREAVTEAPEPTTPFEPPSAPDAGVQSPSAAIEPAREYESLSPAPRLLPNPNLAPAGACPECAPGEYSVAVRGQAEKYERGDTCSTAGLDAVRALALEVNGALVDELRSFAGALQESNGNDVLRLLPSSLRASLRSALESESGSCEVLGLVLPAGARYIGFRYQAGERSVMAECPQAESGVAQPCQVGDAAWLGPPTVVRTDGVTLVLGVFENRAKRSTRLPRMVVYFEPSRDWLPPSR